MKIVFNTREFRGSRVEYSDQSGIESAPFVQGTDWLDGNFDATEKPQALVDTGAVNQVEQFDLKEHSLLPKRAEHQIAVFNGKIFVIGGRDGSGYLKDVWSSDDGKIWTEETSDADFGKRAGFGAVVLNGKIFVIGGDYDSGYYKDVWSSSDGKIWVEETSDADFGERDAFGAVVFNGKIFVIGGRDGSGYYKDVWSSSDGKIWTEETSDADFGKRSSFGAVVLDDKICVIGGRDGSGYYKDVWSSSDGKIWVEETSDAAFGERASFGVSDSLYGICVIGGRDGSGYLKDVWSSFDGKVWTEETSDADFGKRAYFDMAVQSKFDHQHSITVDTIFLAGGVGGFEESEYLNDVWSNYFPSLKFWKKEYVYTTAAKIEDFDVKEIIIGETLNIAASVNASKSIKLPRPRFAMDGVQIKDATAIALRTYTMQSVPMDNADISFLLRLYRENKNKPVLVIWEAGEYGDEPMLATLKIGAATRKAFIYQVKITLTEVL